MTNGEFLNECRVITNMALKEHARDLSSRVNYSIWLLKEKREAQCIAKGEEFNHRKFHRYAMYFRPVVESMILACEELTHYNKTYLPVLEDFE